MSEGANPERRNYGALVLLTFAIMVFIRVLPDTGIYISYNTICTEQWKAAYIFETTDYSSVPLQTIALMRHELLFDTYYLLGITERELKMRHHGESS